MHTHEHTHAHIQVAKNRDEKYQLFWGEEVNFVRLAARFGAIIVPFAAVGGDDAYEVAMEVDEVLENPLLGPLARWGARLIDDSVQAKDLVWWWCYGGDCGRMGGRMYRMTWVVRSPACICACTHTRACCLHVIPDTCVFPHTDVFPHARVFPHTDVACVIFAWYTATCTCTHTQPGAVVFPVRVCV